MDEVIILFMGAYQNRPILHCSTIKKKTNKIFESFGYHHDKAVVKRGRIDEKRANRQLE